MIISRTPFRMSFFGGGTDYPKWSQEHGGAVLTTAIDKYCYISCRYLPPFFEHRSRIVYSRIETVKSNEQIEHPAVRGVLQRMDIMQGIEIHHDGDLPAQTGLGSSSSFTVGLLHALFALRQVMPTPMQLAREAIHIEQEILKENVGCQDQVIAAVGGLRRIDFYPNGEIRATPIILGQERLEAVQNHLMLFFTGFSRTASVIVQEQLDRMKEKTSELTTMLQMVDESVSLLTGRAALVEFGKLLHESWKLKRTLSSKISSPEIDEIYEGARAAGAIGGKLLGAGGGGFMIVFARPDDHGKIHARLKNLLRVPFRFEHAGSGIIVYQPEIYQGHDEPLRTAFRNPSPSKPSPRGPGAH